MKSSLLVLSFTTICAFVGTYFMKLTADNAEQYLALVAVVFTDGFFGVWAGTKTEGFQTRKALKVLQTLVVWTIMLTCILMIEIGFQGTSWLSETIMAPFIVFQLMSALKNANRAGLVQNELLTLLLNKIDNHKEK
jgi:phage-related holin